MSFPIFSESLPLGRDTDIQVRANVLSPWKVTMTVTDRGEVVMVDLNEDDLHKLSIICQMAIRAIKTEEIA
jgi:hypothetical protein